MRDRSLQFEFEVDSRKLARLKGDVESMIEDAHGKIGNPDWFKKAGELLSEIEQAEKQLNTGQELPPIVFEDFLLRLENLSEAFPAGDTGR